MAVRSRRLFGPTVTTSASVLTLFTCPSGRTALFRGIYIATNDAATRQFRLEVNVAASTHLIWMQDLPAKSGVALPQEIVLNPGDTLRGQCVTNPGVVVFSGYGSLLLGEPE